jgi:hypothetical protein
MHNQVVLAAFIVLRVWSLLCLLCLGRDTHVFLRDRRSGFYGDEKSRKHP